MAKNYFQDGTTLVFKNTGATTLLSGSPVVVGDMLGVAAVDIAPGEEETVIVSGVFILPKKAADDIAIGKTVYFDAASNHITTTAGSHTKAGKAFANAGATTTIVPVKLNV